MRFYYMQNKPDESYRNFMIKNDLVRWKGGPESECLCRKWDAGFTCGRYIVEQVADFAL